MTVSRSGSWNFPTRVQFGPGVISRLPAACRELGMTRPLLVLVYQKKPGRPEYVRRDAERKTPNFTKFIRQCLVCRVEFLTEWAGERVCPNCKPSKD